MPGQRPGPGRWGPAGEGARTPNPASTPTPPRGPAPVPAAAPEAGARGGEQTGSATDALERELTVLLRRARAASGELARELHPDLEPAAYGLLVRLEEAQPARATDLAAYFGVGKATMSRQLRALEELGLVAREPDPADGRAYLMRLTEEGRERFARVRSARRERYLQQLAAWERGEVAELARLLHRLNRLQDEER